MIFEDFVIIVRISMMMMVMMLLRTASEGFAFMGPDLLPSRLSLRICTNPPPLPGAVAVMMMMMMMIMVRMMMTLTA